MWILRDGLCQIIDKVIESPCFLKGLVRVQAACMATGMEHGKRAFRELVIAGNFDPRVEVNVATKTREMEDTIATFMETDFASYLRLGDIDLVGLHALYEDAQSDELVPGPSPLPG